MEERDSGLDRRSFLKIAGAASAAAGVGAAPALAGHWLPPDPNRPPGHFGDGGQADEGDVPQPTSLPQVPWPTIKTEHDRGDAIITRYQGNLDATDFGCAGDHRTGLVYVSQRFTDHIAVFDREREEFGALWNIPTQGSGAHAIKVDAASNSVWFSGGEGARVGRLVLHPQTLRPHNFVEYSPPGDVRTERKPHGLLVLGDEVWYTDDRGDRTGWVDVATGFIGLIREDDGSEAHIESDGINVETATGRRRVWVGGGNQVTVIDAKSKRIEHRVTIPEEPGFTQLRVHDIHYEPQRKRVYVLLRGSDHVVWFDARDPEAGPQEFINPGRTAAGLDHVDLGTRYLWWTEGLANNVTRYDLETGEVRPYQVPNPAGYFNPHGIWVSPEWREVWFTEREALCRLRFKTGGPV
ncbi:MAG TPA: hypothetical protein VGR12_00290 [Solirubrobacteraceae bacterium]|nr:hypothetical protein [Solirubrobacteraceae bacterium]